MKKQKRKAEGQHEEEIEVVEYIGGGSYLPGVPARDLTIPEWKHHKKAILASPQATELYDIPEEERPAPKEEEAAQEDSGNG